MGKRANKSTDEMLRTVLAVLRGEVTLAEAGRTAGVSDMTVAKWRDRFVEGGTSALAGQGDAGGREHELETEVEDLKAALGEAHAELRVVKKGLSTYELLRTSKR